jgi:hypothetical protein
MIGQTFFHYKIIEQVGQGEPVPRSPYNKFEVYNDR